jgi:NADH dehydrogenase (ubiquinone) 1 beta subcomplex subunit 3
MKGAFPGFGIAVVAFTGYVIVEQLFFAKDHHGHEHDESAGHHKAL